MQKRLLALIVNFDGKIIIWVLAIAIIKKQNKIFFVFE